MKRLILVLLLAALCTAQEIKRPTTDADNGRALCGGTPLADTTSMAAAYDTTNPPPNGTAATDDITGWLSPSGALAAGRIFSTWQTPSGAYSALTLNVNLDCIYAAGGSHPGGKCQVDYSLNAGSSWTTLISRTSGNVGQQTASVSIPSGTPLSSLRVRYCIMAANDLDEPSTETINLWDIWTSGTLLGGGSIVPTSKGSRSRCQF